MPKAVAAAIGAYEHSGRYDAVADYDAALMLTFQKGNDLAFQELVERNHPRVIGLAYRFTNNAAEAEDLAQEVFLRIYRARHTYKPTAKFSTWMFRIAANASLNALRARAKRRDDVSMTLLAGEEDHPAALPDTESRSPDHLLHQRDLRETVREAIQALPEKQQVAVILNKYEGLDHAEIARMIGCSTMAVKSLLARARDNLRNRLFRHLGTASGQPSDG
jgi:RNA polymerase sigma-70 factor (ECF subfamily)